jgi:hypothetical protein
MNLRITFDVFSGRPNPSVVLDANTSAQLLEHIGAIPAISTVYSRAEPPRLGYRGLVIEQMQTGIKPLPRLRLAGGRLFGPMGMLKMVDPFIESSILQDAALLTGASVDAALGNAIRSQSAQLAQAQPVVPASSLSPEGPLVCKCAPLYEPEWWNDGAAGGAKQFSNNCYNYACDYRTDTFAQPGNAANAVWTHLICANVRPAAIADGLVESAAAKKISCPKEGHRVALVMWQDFDYHWYRMGRDGFWSHKPGGMPVKNVDESDRIITDPRTADRGPYTIFCTFMIVMHGHIKLK